MPMNKPFSPPSAKDNFAPSKPDQISAMSRTELEEFALKTWGLNEELKVDNQIDALSGSFTRKAFDDQGHIAVEKYNAETAIGIVVIDGDGFKWINDNLGHAVGDQVISVIFKTLEDLFPYPNIVGRLGGDECGIVTVGLTREDIKMRFDMLIGKIQVPIQDDQPDEHIKFTKYIGDKTRVNVALSYGVSMRDKDHSRLSDIKGAADHEMYQNKKERKRIGTDVTKILQPGEDAAGVINIFPPTKLSSLQS